MSHLAPARKIWRKSFRGIPNICPRRRRSTVAAAPEVQAIAEDHSGFSRCPFHRSGQKLATAAAAEASGVAFHPAQRTSAGDKVKPFEEIPTAARFPFLGNLPYIIIAGGGCNLHKYCDAQHKALGDIFKDRLGTDNCVVISSKELIDTVFLHEGKHPVHMVPPAWELYNKLTGTKRGIFFMNGEEWCSRRRLLNEALMTHEAVAEHAEAFKNVTIDMVNRWEVITAPTTTTGEWGIVDNLEKELYNWSVESMGTMLMGKRLGCILTSDAKNQIKHNEFVECVRQIFEESSKMTFLNPEVAHYLNLPVWKRFDKAATQAITLARGYVEERMAEIRHLQSQGQTVTGVLSRLMTIPGIQADEIVSIISDLIIAAADTTSHAAQWALYSLSKNPRCQEELLKQIRAVVAPGEAVEAHHLHKIPYAMQIVKESLRLYPVASFLSRRVPEDIVLGGYQIPAGTYVVMSQYTVGRDPKNFPDVMKFQPERWGKEQKKLNPGSRVCTPFGVGVRSCVGKRVAECKTPLMLCNVIQRFHLESANDREVHTKLRMITAPDQPIKIRLIPRKGIQTLENTAQLLLAPSA